MESADTSSAVQHIHLDGEDNNEDVNDDDVKDEMETHIEFIVVEETLTCYNSLITC